MDLAQHILDNADDNGDVNDVCSAIIKLLYSNIFDKSII